MKRASLLFPPHPLLSHPLFRSPLISFFPSLPSFTPSFLISSFFLVSSRFVSYHLAPLVSLTTSLFSFFLLLNSLFSSSSLSDCSRDLLLNTNPMTLSHFLNDTHTHTEVVESSNTCKGQMLQP